MGVVIFTKDASRYQTGHYLVMRRELSTPPTAPDMTFILHSDGFSEKDVLYWAPIVPYRLVVVTSKMPRLTSASENIAILDATLKSVPKPDYGRAMRAALCWADRERASRALSDVPMPLANAFVEANSTDIEVGRLLARCRFHLHDDYARAVITYGVEPVRQFAWPKSSKGEVYILPSDMRESDRYWDTIVHNDVSVANEVRRDEPDALPADMKKRKERGMEWL